ncbi:hypothetical protein MMYC01_208301 [Madurella mycetomatis]|uniref:Uncharacterized protein n=1 Tax=Madurella mycetomatis TaxID=100816 RepID=A0A175VXG1_9PEZI|nr:hypothetical protein MMYC01_208301 [Madurella mycetomatis]
MEGTNNDLQFVPWANEPDHGFPNHSGMWPGAAPLMPYDSPTMFDNAPNEMGWTDNGIFWDHSATASPSLQSYPPVWPISPEGQLQHDAWSPSNQPLPSPLSEIPSPILTRAASVENGLTPVGSTISSPRGPTDMSHSGSPFDAMSILPAPDSAPKVKGRVSGKDSKAASSKRSARPEPKPRPRAHVRRKSESASASSAADRPTRLGGVLPPGIDPRTASEKIRREAWERCRAEVLEMSQRRLMLLDHERGALERETQKLQVNIGLMRETIARQQAGLEDAVRRAEKLGSPNSG